MFFIVHFKVKISTQVFKTFINIKNFNNNNNNNANNNNNDNNNNNNNNKIYNKLN